MTKVKEDKIRDLNWGLDAEVTYSQSGVDTAKAQVGLERLLGWVNKTLSFRQGLGSPLLDIGYFANVLRINQDLGIAISTDGVGTKILVAQMMGKYDTVGIDCVAMNANDVICVGAEPISMVDYLAIQDANPDFLEEIGKGLFEGARQANINIPSGEIAQIKEMVKSFGDGQGFDLVGTCVGTVSPDKILIGQDITEGDVILGLRSNGVHSNGLTLAREVLINKAGLGIEKYIDDFGQTVGEELLAPTRIYVPEIMALLRENFALKALIHITSDGFLNMTRVKAQVGYVIDYLPEPQPVFSLIQRLGNVSDEEMFKVFNMGIGFCVVVSESDAEKALMILKKLGVESCRIGHAVADREKKVTVKPRNLLGKNGAFFKY